MAKITYYKFLQLRLDVITAYRWYSFHSPTAVLTKSNLFQFLRLEPKPEYAILYDMCKQVDYEILYESKEFIQQLIQYRKEMIEELKSQGCIFKLWYDDGEGI